MVCSWNIPLCQFATIVVNLHNDFLSKILGNKKAHKNVSLCCLLNSIYKAPPLLFPNFFFQEENDYEVNFVVD